MTEALDILNELLKWSAPPPASDDVLRSPFVRGSCALHFSYADAFKVRACSQTLSDNFCASCCGQARILRQRLFPAPLIPQASQVAGRYKGSIGSEWIPGSEVVLDRTSGKLPKRWGCLCVGSSGFGLPVRQAPGSCILCPQASLPRARRPHAPTRRRSCAASGRRSSTSPAPTVPTWSSSTWSTATRPLWPAWLATSSARSSPAPASCARCVPRRHVNGAGAQGPRWRVRSRLAVCTRPGHPIRRLGRCLCVTTQHLPP